MKNNITSFQSRKNIRNRVPKNKKMNKAAGLSLAMQKKLAILFFMVLLAFVGLSARIIYINKNDGERYKKQVLSQQEYDSLILPYKRGDILDAKGTKLAYSEKVYNLVIDSKLILQKEKYLPATMNALKACFPINENEIVSYIKENPSNQYKVFLKQLTYDQIEPFLEMEKDKKKNPDIVGVWFEEEYKRVYPNGSLACDIVGFTGKDNIGNVGLEEYYNDELNGINGREYGYLNDDASLERTTKPAKDGNTIVSTVDANIQRIVEKHILAFNKKYEGSYREGELGSKNTGVIVMDVKTGEILAMASYPTFDLNDPKNLDSYYTSEQLEGMTEEDKFKALNEIWRNFCISDTYEPGSTGKAMTIAAGLDSGKIRGDETYNCNGFLEVSGHKIHCFTRIGHGELSVSGALEKSCNVALMHMAQAMGKDTLMKYLYNFGLGLKTNIDLAGEARTDTLVYDVEKMVASDLAVCSFGQGYKVTQIQLASAFCAVVNGGYYYEPHMVSEVLDENGSIVRKIEPRVLKQVISNTTSARMRTYLQAVCDTGTGKKAKPAGYLIGGKTGTAEKIPRKQGNYVVSFIGYAPADDPQVVVYAVVDEPNTPDQAHSDFAQEIVRNIYTELLPYMNIFRTQDLTLEEIEELKRLNIIPSDSISGNSVEVSENSVPSTDSPVKDDGGEEAGTSPAIDLSTFEKDPETGYLIDPDTGALINPETGEYINPSFE